MQVEHKTEKGTVTFFLPSPGADRFKYFNDEKPYLSYFVGHETFREYFPKGTVLIGLTSEVTEETAKIMVDEYNDYGLIKHKDYRKGYFTHSLFSALDSFKSLMQHLQVYEVNPYEYPIYHDYTSDVKWKEANTKWLEAESTTGKWIVLFKPND